MGESRFAHLLETRKTLESLFYIAPKVRWTNRAWRVSSKFPDLYYEKMRLQTRTVIIFVAPIIKK